MREVESGKNPRYSRKTLARQPDRRRQKEFRLEGARLNRQSNGDVETISDWTRRRGRKFECD